LSGADRSQRKRGSKARTDHLGKSLALIIFTAAKTVWSELLTWLFFVSQEKLPLAANPRTS
jgi:hypothetical protein